MAYTKVDLAKRALGIIGKLEAGQTPATEDMDLVTGFIDPLVAYLGLANVIYVGDTDNIDDAAYLPLAARLALEIGPDYGLPPVDDETKLMADKPLRRIAASRPSGAPVKMDWF